MPINSMYTKPCCGMIAVKREVAAYVAGFPVPSNGDRVFRGANVKLEN